MKFILPLILAVVLSSTASADHCPGCPKAPALVPVVPYAVPPAQMYRTPGSHGFNPTVQLYETTRITVRSRIVTGERRPVRRVFGRVFGFMGACR